MIDFTNPMRVLEALTVGGSEFHDDPKRCYQEIRRVLDYRHKLILRYKKERDELAETVRFWEMLYPEHIQQVTNVIKSTK